MKIYPVCVPTHGRLWDKAGTLKFLAKSTITTFVYSEPNNLKVLKESIPLNTNLIFVESDLGEVNNRNFIVEHQLSLGNEKIYMFDDDVEKWLKLTTLPIPEKKTSRNFNDYYIYHLIQKTIPEEFFQIFQSELPDNCVMATIGNDSKIRMTQDISTKDYLRIDGRQFMDLRALRDKGLKFVKDTFCNIDMVFQLVSNGYPCPKKVFKLMTISDFSRANSVIYGQQQNRMSTYTQNTINLWPEFVEGSITTIGNVGECVPKITSKAKKTFYKDAHIKKEGFSF